MSVDKLMLWISIACGCGLLIAFGAITADKNLFPGKQVKFQARKIVDVVKQVTETQKELNLPGGGPRFQTYQPEKAQPGLTLIGAVGADAKNAFTVVEADGTEIHKWAIDWFEIWPDADQSRMPKELLPNRHPGVVTHGFHVTQAGEIVFNFEYLSTVKLNACGDVMWKLDNRGHHFVTPDYDDDLWVGEVVKHENWQEFPYQNYRMPVREDSIVELSPEGEAKRTFSMIDLYHRNDLHGLMTASSTLLEGTWATRDVHHLNDAELFPADMVEGFFKRGDMILSPRNDNTVLVFDTETMEVKHHFQGRLVRQHDPDFTSGNSYIVFDNHNRLREGGAQRSRILEVTVDDNGNTIGVEELLRGPNAVDFFTAVMGWQQPLANGNMLVVVSFDGRILELTPEGEAVWEFRNAIGENRRGAVTDAERLPPEMDAAFFAEARAACGGG
ncbi:MAG: arylsulfotransferase family protein [Pseudomonadota bacterium]